MMIYYTIDAIIIVYILKYGGILNMQKVFIYSDGSARKNPEGPGGYGTIVRYMSDDLKTIIKEEEFTQGFEVTTNNRMELLGVIVGIESLRMPCDIIVYSDSQYLVNAFNQHWISNWQKNGWLTSQKTPVKNKEMWERLLDAKKPHNTIFVWIKGHSGHPENERCDYLATSSADGKQFVKDVNGLYSSVLEDPKSSNSNNLFGNK